MTGPHQITTGVLTRADQITRGLLFRPRHPHRGMAERTHVNEGTIARSLLTMALDEADPDPRNVTQLLDGIPGAFERAEHGLAQIRAGDGKPLSSL